MSPQGRSRTRRIFRSYQARWRRPQAPHAVFPPAAGAGSRGRSGRRRCPPRSERDGTQENDRHLAGIGVVASCHHARCLDHQNSPVSVERTTLRMLFSPTRQDEEPLLYMCELVTFSRELTLEWACCTMIVHRCRSVRRHGCIHHNGLRDRIATRSCRS